MMASFYAERPWLKHYSPWVPSDLEIPRENLVRVLQKQAVQRESKPALYYFGRSLSFGELDRWSNALCAALQAMGLKKGDRVIFYLQNIPQFVIAQYAVWKAGAIVVPLNPMYREKELEYFFQNSGARMLITLGSSYETTGSNVIGRM